jgi:excisionase family DNA binding protein
MTLQQVADYLHCNYDTANKLARQGEIPSFRLTPDGGWRFLKSDLDEWIAKGGGPASGGAPAKPEGGRRGRKPKPRTTKS